MRNLFRAAGGILVMLLVACAAVPPVQAQVSNQAYSQTGDASLSVSNSSTRVVLGSNESTAKIATTAVITNTGSNDAHIALGGSSVTAATSDYLIPAGQWRQINIGSQTYLAAITSSSTTTLDISTGVGSQLGGGSGSSSGVSSTITGPLGSQPAASSVSVAVASDQNLSVTGSVVASGTVGTTAADGSNVTLGTTTDAKNTATDTTAVTGVSLWKQQSASLQAIATSVAGATPAGTNLIGGVNPLPATSGGLSSCYLQAAASSNSTNCKASAGQLYHIRVVGNGTAIGYLRLYNLSSAPTCTSATGLQDAVPVPQPAGGGGGGFVEDIAVGEAFSTGIGFCFSGAIGTTDNTSVAATTWQITLLYK